MNKKRFISLHYIFPLILFMSSCAGIQYMTVETQEPAQLTLPENIRSLLIVDNVVQQPDEVGHRKKPLGKKEFEPIKVSADSISVYYTEALTQFLSEEHYFDTVILYNKPLRADTNFWEENPIMPEKMNELRKVTETDAIVSLDKLMLQTEWSDLFMQEGYIFATMTGKIHSILRVYMPTLEGKIPAIHFTDSLRWEGFDIRDNMAYANLIIPTPEEGMKQLAVYAAEKMVNVFVPHWEIQNRWYYTLNNKLMRDGEAYAKSADWTKAILKWQTFYNTEKNKLKKAKAASNIALAYEMLGEMDKAFEWITWSLYLFEESLSPNSLDRRRAELYKNEIKRRRDQAVQLNMQRNRIINE